MIITRMFLVSVLALLNWSFSAIGAHACDPLSVILRDVSDIPLNDQTRIALLLTMSLQQYDAANKALQGKLAYAPDMNLVDARVTAQLDAQAAKFSHDRQYYLDYLTRFLSPRTSDEYSACILEDIDKSKPGLTVWIERQQGDFLFVGAFWVGQSADVIGKHSSKLVGLETLQEPPEWNSGVRQHFVLKKTSKEDAYASIIVAAQSAFLVVAKEPITGAIGTNVILAEKASRITSGGTSDGHSPFCQARTTTGCVQPRQPGGYLVVGTGTASNVSRTGSAGFRPTQNTPQQICIVFGHLPAHVKLR
jgi:hypothetical protein